MTNSPEDIATDAAPLDGCRVSPQQEQMFRGAAEGGASRAVVRVRVDGTVDVDRLARALDHVSRRHEILRTSFRLQVGMRTPLQIVHAQPLVALEQVAAIDHLPPSDLSGGPVLRAWVSPDGGHTDLALTLPSMCADSTTLTLLVDELAAAYAGRPSPATDPVQYADYAEWQHQTIAGTDEAATAGRRHWTAGRGESERLWLPGARSAAKPEACNPQCIHVPVSSEVSRQLTVVAQSSGVPLARIWLAGWATLIARVAAASRVSMRVVLDGRNGSELAEALGPYAKAVPVSLDIEDEPFTDLARQASSAIDEAEKWQDYFGCEGESAEAVGFEWIAPLASEAATRAMGWTITARRSHARSNLRLVCEPARQDSFATLWYDASLMTEGDATRVSDQLGALLESVGRDATTRVGALSLRARDSDLARASGTGAPPPETRLDAWIAAQAAATPAAIAVVGADGTLTYAALMAQAARVAARLVQAGVHPGAAVGICGERSAALLAAVLGVWRAGAAYVPVGPDQPPARVADQLAECAVAAVVVTDASGRAALAGYAGPVLSLVETESTDAVPPRAVGTPDEVAYILFTSGSTGRPKGVVVRHRNLAAYTAAIVETLGPSGVVGVGTQWATVSALTADLGNTCIFPALVSGGTVHMVPSTATLDGAALGAYMTQHGVDVLKITPSHLAAVLNETSAVLPRRALLLGGEALSWTLVAQVRERSMCEVWNHYGPTETTVGALMYAVPATPGRTRTVPIGRPLGQTTIALVDTAGEPVPVGVPGELWIGGPGVAAGYLHQAARTAERFVTPGWEPSAFWYRTGDRVRMDADGDVEFLGRVDDQVKIRGYRVEPGEVEQVLRGVPGLRDAAVVVAEGAGEPRLAAYIVGEPGLTEESARAILRDRLPEYMVPATLTTVDSLPRLPNGKVDRRRLAVSSDAAPAATPVAEPRSPVEATLCEIWQTLLARPVVGIHDNFFELGGHSLLATQVIAQVRKAFDVQLPLAAIFDAPTVAGLADAVSQLTATAASDPEIDRILASVEGLSDAEVQWLLEHEQSKSDV